MTDIDGLLGQLYAHALIAPCCFDPQQDALFVHRAERDIAARERVPGSVQGNKHWWWGAGDYGSSSPPFFKQLFGRSQEVSDG